MPDLTPFFVAFQSHQWALFAALLVGAIVALSKQGWLSAWLAAKLPATVRPWFALLVAALTTGSGDIIAGKTWQNALQDVLLTFVTAMMGHQILIESLRNGREFIAKKMGFKPGGAVGASQSAVLIVALAGSLFAARAMVACTPAQTAAMNAVFTDVQTACQAEALATSVIPAGTEPAVVAKDIEAACGMADTLLPWITNVVNAWMANQAATGTTPTVPTYTPTPMKKRLAPHASLAPLDRPRWRPALSFGVPA